MNYIPFVLLIMYSFFTACQFSQNSDKVNCEKYKNGLFVYYYPGSHRKASLLIERNDSVQTENNQSNGQTTYLNVKWLDQCTYELEYLSSTYVLPDSFYKLIKAHPLKTRITKVEEKYYTFETSSDFDSTVLRDTIWRLRK